MTQQVLPARTLVLRGRCSCGTFRLELLAGTTWMGRFVCPFCGQPATLEAASLVLVDTATSSSAETGKKT